MADSLAYVTRQLMGMALELRAGPSHPDARNAILRAPPWLNN